MGRRGGGAGQWYLRRLYVFAPAAGEEGDCDLWGLENS